MRSKGTAGLLVCALVVAAFAPARATVEGGGPSAPAAPVAVRVSLLTGGTMTVTRGSANSAPAALNTALLPGDAFATSGASTHAEIQLDGYTSLRLGGDVRGSIAAGDAHARRIEIFSGLVELSLWRGEEPDFVIVTPALTLRTHYAGSYRIAVAAGGTTSVTARSGQADAIVPDKTYTLVAGQTLEGRVWGGNVSVNVKPEIARDDFDAFNQSRDRALSAAIEGNPQLPASLAGYDDLSGYGAWSSLTSYGQVWVPQQTAGWAPYRDGNWDYDTGYGWTWVGAEPWGWVPYHYGRWIYARRLGWCWYPPPIGLLPVWAPGLVAFFGYGFGSFGYSGYGWVPLAPYEPYYPWYPYAYGYARPPLGHKRRLPPKPAPDALSAYRNARDGGGSTLGARAWSPDAASRPVAIDPAHLLAAKPVEGRLPLAPSHVPAAPWAEEFTKAATILDGIVPLQTRAAMPPLHDVTLPGAHAPAPAMHPALPTMHQAPPEMHRAPPAVRLDQPVSTRSGGSRPPA